MKHLLLSIATAVTLFSCTTEITEPITPQLEKVKNEFQTNARKHNLLAEGVNHIRTPFFEINTHSFNTETITVSYTEGVNNQPMYEVMDSFQYNFDSTSVTFNKEYSNGTVLNLTYFNTDSVFEYRYFPIAGGNKRTSFYNN